MKFTTRSKLLGLPAILLLAPLVRAQAPIQFASTADLGKVRTSACNPATPMAGMITPNTPPETLLFNVVAPPGSPTCPPVLAPDGHQITLGEFRQADGRVIVKCINTGTLSVVHFSGLIPGGTYSVWQFILRCSFQRADTGRHLQRLAVHFCQRRLHAYCRRSSRRQRNHRRNPKFLHRQCSRGRPDLADLAPGTALCGRHVERLLAGQP